MGIGDSLPRDLESLLGPELELHEYRLVELETLRGGGRITLRVTIERHGDEPGVDVEDCAKASRAIGRLLDAQGEDLLHGRYVIEVSSPGIFRRLSRPADFERYVDSTVRVTAAIEEDKTRQVRGPLVRADEKGIEIEDESQGRVSFSYEDIKRAHLDPDLDLGSKKKQKRSKH